MPTILSDDGRLKMAKMSAEAWWFIEEARYSQLSEDEQAFDRLSKWRKFLAIMEVSLRYPIYSSRHAPECIMLSWFFGFPSFGREQDVEKLRRIPAGADKKWLERWAQGDFFKAAPLLSEAAKSYEGDDEFRRMCEEVERNVLATLQ
jgi:hypothetical protein